jgi:hypothetical protein
MATCLLPKAPPGTTGPGDGTVTEQPAEDAAVEPAAAPGNLAGLFRAHRWRMVATYLLFNLENLGRLAQPWFLGWAVNDLLARRSPGLVLFVLQHLVNLGLATVRQLYDTRTFTRIYADLATRLVGEQRRRGVDLSRLAARSTLCREVVDFFERDLPVLFYTAYSVGGSLLMIALFDGVLVLPCLAFLAVAGLLTRSLASRSLALNRGLNDEVEREVDVLQHAPQDRVDDHYRRLRVWRIRLCNVQAVNFGATELLSLLLMAVVLFRACTVASNDVGALFSVLGYVMLLTSSLRYLPMWVQQFSRLRDIRRRLHAA